MDGNFSISENGQKYIMNTYSRFPLVFVSGKGMYITDESGREYLDFVAGIAVNCLGHGNERLVEAVSAQAEKLIHCSNLYWTEPQVRLAEKLVNNSGFDRVFFCNSGAEAIEGALKLARRYGYEKGKYEVVAMNHSFHGRTMGAVTATGQEKYQKWFKPLLPGVVHVDFNDFEALKEAVTDKTCAVLIEPVQGEGGIRPADREYLTEVRRLCNDNDILLIFDEVQCGIGRCGYLFAHEYYGVQPDAVAIAKGLGGGVPIGALLARGKADVFSPGEHASTFGGNPLAAAAGNVVIDELLGGLCANAEKMGEYLRRKLNELKDKYKEIVDVRGFGLMQGIEMSMQAAPVIAKCIEDGLLLVGAGTNVIRFVPALIVSEADIDKAVRILDEAIGKIII